MLVVGWANKLGRRIDCVLSIVRSEREWVNWRFDLSYNLSSSVSVLPNTK